MKSKKCIKCQKCIDICPTINKTEVNNNPVAYACINKNEKIRLESSSGGIFSLVADYILENEGIVFGARFNDDFEVIHDYIEKKEIDHEILELSNSIKHKL
jgi:Fe-S-cluster-containing hydrogenase component 2